MAIILLIGLFFGLIIPAYASLPDRVMVDLFEARSPLKQIVLRGPFQILEPARQTAGSGVYQICVDRKKLVLKSQLVRGNGMALAASRFVLTGCGSRGIEIQPEPNTRRDYRGTIQVYFKDGAVKVRNTVDTKDYVSDVVGSETLPDWPSEMLKAQAVLTQTRLARYKSGDQLGDSTNKEAYLGADYERPLVRQAVSSVWGQTLTFNGTPVIPFYHSTCAGGTSNGEAYFHKPPGSMPYLSGTACTFCKGSPFWETKASSISIEIFGKVSGKESLPVVTDIDQRKRPLLLKLSDGRLVSGYEYWLKLGQKLGWDKVPGTRYSLGRSAPNTVTVKSTGAGHGIGLCQWGAAELSRRGKNYKQILQYYFPGTKVETR